MYQKSSFLVVIIIFLSLILIGCQSAEANQLATQPLATQPIAAQPIAPQPIAPQPIAPQPIAAQPIATGEKEEKKANVTKNSPSNSEDEVYYDNSVRMYLARVTKVTTARDPFALRPDNSSAIHAEIEQELQARNRNSLFLTVCLSLCGGVILILGLVLLVVYKVRQAKAHLEAAEYIFYKENMPLLAAQRLDAQSPTTATTTPATTTLATTTPASTPATTTPATTPATTTPVTTTPATSPVPTSPAVSLATSTTTTAAAGAAFPSSSAANTVGGQRGSSVGTPTTWTSLQGSSGPPSRLGLSPAVSSPLPGPNWQAPLALGSPAYGVTKETRPGPSEAKVKATAPEAMTVTEVTPKSSSVKAETATAPVPASLPVSAPGPAFVPVGPPGPAFVPVGPPGPAFVPVSSPGSAFVPVGSPGSAFVPVSAPGPAFVPVGSPGSAFVPVGPRGSAFVPVSAPLTPVRSKEEEGKARGGNETGGKPRVFPASTSAMQISETKKKEELTTKSTSRHTVK